MKRFADLPLEVAREYYLRVDRKTGKPYVLRNGEKYEVDPLTAINIAESANRTIGAIAMKKAR